MRRTDAREDIGTQRERTRARTPGVLWRTVFRRKWVLACAALVLLALTVWVDISFGYLTGVRVLYILPIWLGIWIGGAPIGILGALVATFIMGRVDLAQLRMDADVSMPNGIARFVSLALVALVISHLEKKLRTARETAIHDPLTGALNRTELKSVADQAIAYSKYGGPSVALALIDCDKFKEVNDNHGHACGDKALRALGRILETIDGKAVTVGRMGGDEFAVLFVGVAEAKVREWMERAAQQYFAETKKLGLHTTISVGLAFHCEEPVTFQMLLEEADRQMYAQKRRGNSAAVHSGGSHAEKDGSRTVAHHEARPSRGSSTSVE